MPHNADVELDLAAVDLCAALTTVLETTAFLSPLPPAEPPAPPAAAMLAAIDVTPTGRPALSLELACGAAFALTLAANLLGTDPADPEAELRARDALKELMNVTAGTIIPSLPGFPEAAYEMSIPRVDAVDAPAQWEAFAASAGAVALDVEGHAVAIRLVQR